MIAGLVSGVIDLGRENDARLHRLRTALALGSGFQLVIVQVEPGPIRTEVIRRIESWSNRDAVGALEVMSLDANSALSAQLKGKSGAIVHGLEPVTLTDADAATRDWVAELNWTRDALPALVSGPLILVVSQATHGDLFEHAHDLYSWRRHTVRIEVVVRELALPLSSPGDPYWLQQREHFAGLVADLLAAIPGEIAQVDRIVFIAGPAFLGLLADAYLQLGDEPAASTTLDKAAVFEGSEFHEAMLKTCKLQRLGCAVMRGDVATARALLADVPETYGAMLFRGKIDAIAGLWDTAVVELSRVIARSFPDVESIARAQEYLCQIAFARGDIKVARDEISALIKVTHAHCDEWGAGLLLRLANAIADVYPDEPAPLLHAVTTTIGPSRRRDVLVAAECVRAKCAWLLQRPALVQEAFARVRRFLGDDAKDALAAFSFCEGIAAMAAGNAFEDQIIAPLARARTLFRTSARRAAAATGCLLGQFLRAQGRFEDAVTEYRAAAADARVAGDAALEVAAQLGELVAAVDGGIEADDTSDRLRMLCERFQLAGHDQSEAVARMAHGRCLLRDRSRDRAVVELERARDCFAVTTDAAGERAVLGLLDAVA